MACLSLSRSIVNLNQITSRGLDTTLQWRIFGRLRFPGIILKDLTRTARFNGKANICCAPDPVDFAQGRLFASRMTRHKMSQVR
jgi:hypothetical protein